MLTDTRPKEQLSALGLRAKYHFGQNFLADEALARKIAALAVGDSPAHVVEIGAGLGALTAPLLERAGRVVAIERDRDLVPALRTRFAAAIDEGRLIVQEADAKSVDWFEPFEEGAQPIIAGNLPYQLTGPLLERLCGVAARVHRVVLLVQLEVAERLVAAPSTPAYGGLSVFVQAQYLPARQFIIRRGAFYPQPNVDSAVVTLEPRRPPLASETPLFRSLVQRAFGQRRKQLRNAWREIDGRSMQEIVAAAATAGIDLGLRGESLGVSQFWRMAGALEHGASQP